MKIGFLNDYFRGVAVKRLVPGEVNAMVSNQHEFNVNRSLLKLLGTPEGKYRCPTKYLYLSDFDDEQTEHDSYTTWYNAREGKPRYPEYRLYFPSDAADVIGQAQAGDSMFLCIKPDNTRLLIISKQGSTTENQLYYLFDLMPAAAGFESRVSFDDSGRQVGIVVRTILERIGVEYEDDREKRLFENLIDRFDGTFPTTDEFSKYARSTVEDADPIGRPDEALMLWYDRETALFKMMERHIIESRLKEGFLNDNGVDVEGFISFSLSVQNRRKSRAGMALENGVSEILRQNGILFDRTPVTENRNKPDFLFPGKDEYHDISFPTACLTMLGAKTTSKDRWRQVLDEADKIERKHLITLEGAISTYQTEQMKSRNLQLVVPSGIQSTYTAEQQDWLYSVSDFLYVVKERQKEAAKFSDRVLAYCNKLGIFNYG